MPEYDETRTGSELATEITAVCSRTEETGSLCFYNSWSGKAGDFEKNREEMYAAALNHELKTGHTVKITVA